MKRQDVLATSSSHRENGTERQKMKAKAIGCMSGLFHLLSSYRSRNKFLTFGNKQEKKRKLCSTITSEVKPQDVAVAVAVAVPVNRLSSSDLARSPTIPVEIRHHRHRHSRRSAGPPAVVARLMGLEEEAPSKQLRPQEKRLELLEALEKCDRDLNDLKKIIDAIQSSPPDRTSYHCYKRQSFGNGKVQHQFQIEQNNNNKALGDENFITGQNIFDRITYESLQRRPVMSRDIIHTHNLVERFEHAHAISSMSMQKSPLVKRRNKAMKDTIEEVSRDIAWGQKREIGRIGLALQDHIFRDLIEELVTDFGSSDCITSNVSSLPFEACKRRLFF